MEIAEDIVIVGAGIAGLTTALGLHRLGIRSLVLESSDGLRVAGFALTTWNNAWKALDAIGIGDSLRQEHKRITRLDVTSTITNEVSSGISLKETEVRCVKRSSLLEALQKELPRGTIRYSSKVVSIEEAGRFKLLHLADGTTLKTKVLIGCDGVNSVVAKWLGFKTPVFTGRAAIRAYAEIKDGHGFGPEIQQFLGNGVRSGFIPCDDRTIYWCLTWNPSTQEKVLEENPAATKQFALNKLEKVPDELKAVIEKTQLESIIVSPLRYRRPWELLWGNIRKGNVCAAGDALHPMTPDLGQGGCSALEDGVVLARCLAEALLSKPNRKAKGKVWENNEDEEFQKIEMGLEKYAKERRWRSFDLMSTAYMVGFIQQSNGKIMKFLRDKVVSRFLVTLMLGKTDFDCGNLSSEA